MNEQEPVAEYNFLCEAEESLGRCKERYEAFRAQVEAAAKAEVTHPAGAATSGAEEAHSTLGGATQ